MGLSSTRVRSLRQHISRQLIWVGSLLFVSCLMLMFVFVTYAMDAATDSLMRLEAEAIMGTMHQNPQAELPQRRDFSVYRGWQAIPESVRDKFNHEPILAGEALEAEVLLDDGSREFLYLMHHQHAEYGQMFILSRHSEEQINALMNQLLTVAINQSLGITLIVFLTLFLLIVWLIQRALEPVSMLSEWAKGLHHNPDIADESFPIKELNQLAGQLRQGVDQVKAANGREQEFLKHASHELRTPLAIVQASLDLLDLQTEGNAKASVSRGLKASARMIRLSDALLWLARESDQPLAKTHLRPADLCQQLVDDHRYLLNHRDVDVLMDKTSADTEVLIEDALLSVVMANIIRNAFQHSGDGEIHIHISDQQMVISNPEETQTETCQPGLREPGFGLGLQLVERICEKQGWQFMFERQLPNVRVLLIWGAPR